MDFMTWAHQVASKHSQLQDALITVDDEWLDILLADGRSFRFRPGALIRKDANLDARTDILNRLLTIGIAQAVAPTTPEHNTTSEPEPVDSSEPNLDSLISSFFDAGATRSEQSPLSHSDCDDDTTFSTLTAGPDVNYFPRVDSAPFFLRSHNDGDSIIYLPITDFVAVGLVRETPLGQVPVYYSQTEGDLRDIGELLSEGVANLRLGVNSGGKENQITLGFAQLGKGQVVSFMSPPGYELSWWCDVEMMANIAEQVIADRPGDIPLFIPVALDHYFIAFADDPHLIDVFDALIATSNPETMVYPLPHTLSTDGWTEWIPLPGDDLSRKLSELRTTYRQWIYNEQATIMDRWADLGNTKHYRVMEAPTGDLVGVTTWDATDHHGSVPDTEMITFTREQSPHPFEPEPAVSITLRSQVAREIWSEGFTRDDDAWPPRWKVNGFPDAQTLEKLSAATDREF
ncbi:hypothetical protein JTE88_08830 [Arcanobacterium phocisimile]|uniref:SseB protein N-terminal domain-containing protein n=1 Tax=Arcanobacterium phocisimile TaxID=1302235 RepID=A0ABX7IHZ8_9ACTO|nr:hypothetical protein [Arcanobacterium phocisimile]QRV02154.1 hypothetical protein JTE88_08830 [Arcanobacterium phocisimile]